MKGRSRFLVLFLCFLIFFLIASCTRDGDKLNGLRMSTQATIREGYETPLDEYRIYYFYEDNKLDLGNYDYSSEDYNYIWVEKGIKYEWVDENTIDIKYKGSNLFKVSKEGSKLIFKYCYR